jgi:hypothetical protein
MLYAGSGSNGNWELSMIEGMIGIAVFTENLTLFNHALEFYYQRYYYLFISIYYHTHYIHKKMGGGERGRRETGSCL